MFTERNVVISGLFLLAIWTYVALPFLYTVPRFEHQDKTRDCSVEVSNSHGFWEKASCDPTAYFTLWLVGFTAVLAASTIGLWWVTYRGMKGQANDTRILQRAYLTAIPYGIETTKGGAVIGQVAIRNAGNLPARNVSVSVKIGHWDNRTESEFDDGQIPDHSTILQVGTEMRRGSRALPKGRAILSLKQGYIYVWGRVNYQDGFGVNRWLTFCHRYPCETAEGIPGTSEGISAEYVRHHHNHNDGN